MGEKLGIAYYDGNYAATLERDTGTQIEKPAIGFANWMELINYYTSHAPARLPAQNRQPIHSYSNLFSVLEPTLTHGEPSSTYIKIDPGNQVIYLGSAYDSSFSVYNAQLGLVQKEAVGTVAVNLSFDENLSSPGVRSGMLTNIGSFYPTNDKTGTIHPFHILRNGSIEIGAGITNPIVRPVQTTGVQINRTKKDYLVCGFGHEEGGLYYLHQKEGQYHYETETISDLPGAVNACVDDYNKDGLPDLMVLFAQGDEGIFLFTNKGDGTFERKEILRFPPAYGSSYFEMQDMNSDGLKDIIYTCGDNYDYSRILKYYHGIYIFLNEGNDQFRQESFFPLNGCYKAVGRDFDKDGDVDIAAISFFPDSLQLEESLVYLENKGTMNFSPFTIPQFAKGRWMTMDVGDIDADGDEDIVVGSLVPKTPNGASTKRKGNQPAFLMLLNKTRQRE